MFDFALFQLSWPPGHHEVPWSVFVLWLGSLAPPISYLAIHLSYTIIHELLLLFTLACSCTSKISPDFLLEVEIGRRGNSHYMWLLVGGQEGLHSIWHCHLSLKIFPRRDVTLHNSRWTCCDALIGWPHSPFGYSHKRDKGSTEKPRTAG